MIKESLNDIQAFLTVARERSFTRAAAKLGVSQSALSHTIRLLEERLGVRLLTRTTRSVAATEAGARLIAGVGSSFDHIEAELATLNDLRSKPAGIIRLTSSEYPAESVLVPALAKFLPQYPDIQVEVTIEHATTDIVAGGFDAGIRLGEQVAKDMIAVPVAPNAQMAVVGSPSYFSRHPAPKAPQDLTSHVCINFRTPTHDALYVWEFAKGKRERNVRVGGQITANTARVILQSALNGLGLGYLNRNMAQKYIDAGALVHVLADWCEPFSGYHLFYPSRRQPSPAFTLLVEHMRYRATT